MATAPESPAVEVVGYSEVAFKAYLRHVDSFVNNQEAFTAALSEGWCAWLETLEIFGSPGFFRNPDLADVYDGDNSTAEIAANSPRYRRRSSTFIDGVHDLPDEKSSPMAPAQLYSTMSGRLFHSGRIVIVLVGPPARGKT
jgi:hypothetical protein